MALRILVTRPEPGASSTVEELQRRGYTALKAPMLEPRFLEPIFPEARRFDAVAATSQNGVLGLSRLGHVRALCDLPLFAVGDATAAAARDAGFADVRSAAGDLGDLVRLLGEAPGSIASVLYAAGTERSGDLAAALAPAGIGVTTLEVYRMDRTERLPDEVVAELAAAKVDGILIYSERTAAALVAALDRAGVMEAAGAVPVHAISEKAVRPLADAGFGRIVVALAPNAEALLDTLAKA